MSLNKNWKALNGTLWALLLGAAGVSLANSYKKGGVIEQFRKCRRKCRSLKNM